MSTNNASILINIPEEQRDLVLECVSVFLSHKAKEAKVREFSTETATALAAAGSAITFVSPRLLAKARNDTGFQEILGLFRSSKQEGKINPHLVELFAFSKNAAINDLLDSRTQIFDVILGAQRNNYRELEKSNRANKDETCERIWISRSKSLENHDLVEDYNNLSQEVAILKSGAGFLLREEILNIEIENTDVLERFAFLVFQPKHLTLSEMYTDSEWSNFPLKWCKNHLSIPQIKTLFDMFKDGEDVTEPYLRIVEKEGFDQISQLIDDPILRMYVYMNQPHIKGAINQAIKCHRNTMYMASVYASLPIIEGVLWEYSFFLDKNKIIEIYVPSTDRKQMIGKDVSRVIENPTIGSLLKASQFGDLFDQDFISYFCDDLYNERNPILHGRSFNFGSELNAIKKLATLKYLLRSIQRQTTNWFIKILEAHVPPELVPELLIDLQ